MADSTDVILRLADKQWSSALEAEARMASLTHVLLVALAVLQGFIAARGFDDASLLPAGLIFALGVYGALFARRCAVRVRTEIARLERLIERLDELAPDAGLVAFQKGPIDGGMGRALLRAVPWGLITVGLLNVALVVLV